RYYDLATFWLKVLGGWIATSRWKGSIYMFSRMLQWCAGLALGAMLAGAANATTFLPMVPFPGLNLLAPDTQFTAFAPHPGAAGKSGTDEYDFLYTGAPPLSALNSTTDLS